MLHHRPEISKLGLLDKLKGKKNPEPVFTNAYFLDKAKQMAALGADIVTIKDMEWFDPTFTDCRVNSVIQTESVYSGRFPYSLYPGLWLGAV